MHLIHIENLKKWSINQKYNLDKYVNYEASHSKVERQYHSAIKNPPNYNPQLSSTPKLDQNNPNPIQFNNDTNISDQPKIEVIKHTVHTIIPEVKTPNYKPITVNTAQNNALDKIKKEYSKKNSKE